MQKYITVNGVKYRIRGGHSASELRARYARTVAAMPGTKMTLRGWLQWSGSIHSSVRSKT
jgi:hypothetical protein